MLYYQNLPYIPKVIYLKLISWYYDDLLVDHFIIEKIRDLIARKYYQLTLKKHVEIYIKGYNMCLALIAMRHKLYSDFQSLSVLFIGRKISS